MRTTWAWCLAILLGGCVPAPVPGPSVALSQHWIVGVERMQNDAALLLPYTTRLIVNLSAMPNIQVYYLGTDADHSWFAAIAEPKIRVASWLHGEGTCLTSTYTTIVAGQQSGLFGVNVHAWPTGNEPDPICVDRSATAIYQSMVINGL